MPPATRPRHAAAAAPTQANPASICFWCEDRSAIAPTTGSISAARIVENATV